HGFAGILAQQRNQFLVCVIHVGGTTLSLRQIKLPFWQINSNFGKLLIICIGKCFADTGCHG
ncbi:MAG: hypothetical protein K2W33_11405, partial [Burkholderiales bacterium]|nr:hypothetical protein [Burkholderiales bacterium]